MKLSLTQLQALAQLAAKHFPASVIGGGAPRDAMLGVDVKDIDLFIDTRHTPEGEYEKRVAAFHKQLGGELSAASDPSVEADRSYDLDSPGYPVIQILPVYRCVFNDIFDYDFALSQLAMTANGLLMSSAYVLDAAAGTITYTKHSPDPKSAARLKRLTAKYPTRRLVNCEMLQE